MSAQNNTEQKGLIAWFATNSVAANLLMIFIILGGLYSYQTINKKITPDIELNRIRIAVPFLGASPADVEEGVVVRIEEAIQDVEGIERIDSFAFEGLGQVTVEVENDQDINVVMDEIKAAVDSISTFPNLTETPVINKLKFQRSVMWLSVYGDMDRTTRQTLAQQVRDELVALPEVNSADLVGNRAYEIKVEVSEETLREYGLTVDEITKAIRSSSVDLPGGSINTSGGDILLRTKGQAYSGYDFEKIVLRTNLDGSLLLLGDVANVIDGFAEGEGFAKFDGKPSSNIRIQSTGDENVLEVAAAVRNYIQKKNQSLPEVAQISSWADISYYLQGRLDMMFSNMLMGAILVFMILALFLRLRIAFWVMLGIPISFLGTFMLMPQLGDYAVSVNMLSVFAFILVLGIVVDDAIVIGESVYSTIKEEGQSTQNVIKGAHKVAVPATFGVLTTIAAFAPILLLDSGPAPFFYAIAVVVSLALTFSLIESKWILPAHLAHMKFEPYDQAKANKVEKFQHAFRQSLEQFAENSYRPLLQKALKNRYNTLAIFIAGFFISIGLITGGIVKTEVFPNVPSDFIQVQLTMNDGTAPEVRNQTLMLIQDAAAKIEKDYLAESAQNTRFLKHTLVFTNGNTGGGLFVEMTKAEDRNIDAYAIEKRYREKVGELAGIKELRFFAGTNAGGGAKLELKLTGANYEQLEKAAEELQAKVAEFDGVFDIRNSFSTGTQEIQLKIKPEAELLGITQSSLGRQVRQAFYGEEAQRIQRGRDEVKVMVRYPQQERRSISNLESMRIRAVDGTEVPFSEVADVEIGSSFSSISRVNRKRAITISADINPDKVESQAVIMDISQNYIPKLLHKYPTVSYGLEGSSKVQQELMTGFLMSFVISIFLIYALIAIPTKSYMQPLIVMSVIPFGIIGAIVGHWIFGLSINMMSFFGIIALSGVVVNDSLIMVDFINQSRKQGNRLVDAVIGSGINRFRAILLTSLTTFFGLLPIYFETSLQAQFVIPMAVSLGVGIVFATVITLFLIPCLYLIMEDFKTYVGSKFQSKTIATKASLQQS